ncbi:hypothetical protein [Mesomycoplasma hyopneumoniae]
MNTQVGTRRKRSLSQTKSEFTPIIQKIFVADVKQVNVRTGSSTSHSSSSSSGPEEGEEVKGYVNLYFDKNDAWINSSKIDVKIKEVENQVSGSQILVEKNNLQVTSDNQNKATPYVLKINLDTTKEKGAQSQLKPGQKIEFELEIKENARLKSLESKKKNIKVKVDFPKNQYNLANTPKLEKQVRIPPVVKVIKVTASSDTDAELEVELVGNKNAFKDLEKTPIVITIDPDPDKEAKSFLPFETKKISKVGQLESSTGNTIKVKYQFNGLIPFLKYKIDKIKWGVYDIPFGNNKQINFSKQMQTRQTSNTQQKEKEFQMPFDKLPQDKIKLTQQPWAGLWKNDQDTDNYNEENIDIDLDPVYMWSLNKSSRRTNIQQNLMITLESAEKYEKDKKVTLPFALKFDKSKKTLTASLKDKKVTDYGEWTKQNKWKQLLASTRYVVTKIESDNGPSLTLGNNENNKLTFTTQIEEPDLHTIRMTDFSNPEGRNDTWEQSLILKFYDPWKVLDETKLEQWNFALYNNNTSIKSYLKTTSHTPNPNTKWRIDRVVEVTNNEYIPYINPHEIINEHVKQQERIDQTRVLGSKNKNIYVTEAEDLDRLLREMGGMSKIPYYYQLKSKKSNEVFSSASESSRSQSATAGNPSIPNPSPYRYFKWTLKGDGSWIENESISLELRAYYFRKPDRSSPSTPTSWYDHQTEMQSSSQVQTHQGSTPEEEPIKFESRESKEKDKRKDSKSPIRVFSKGQLIKIENWKQKTNVAFIRETSSEIVSGVGIKIKAKLYDPRQVRKNANKVRANFNRNKFEENISKSIAQVNNYNQAVQSLGSESNKSNVSLTLSWSDYKINNEFSSLLTQPNKKWIELVNKIERKVKWTKSEEKKQTHVTWSRQWETKPTTTKKQKKGSNEVELQWFITYKQPQQDRDNSRSHRYRIGFQIDQETQKNKGFYQNQILTPWNDPKVFLTGATYPQVDKTDPFWGNIFTNQSPGLYRTNTFSNKLDKITNINWDNTIFIGPSSRVKKTSANGSEPEVDRNIQLRTNQKQKQMSQKPFGIYDVQYDQNSKTMTVGLYTKTNQGQQVKFVQEVMPSVMYGWFINNQGDMYLIGNEIGLPIILWRDADFSQQLNNGKITIKLKLQNSASDPRFSPKTGEQLKFLGILVFPHLPPNPNQNPWLREKKHTKYTKDKYYKEINQHKYIMPMHNDQSMTVDAETPYVITWVRREDIWKVITV